MKYDVVIVGGGPAGLSAGLALGRACKRVLLCDSGPRRNQAAVHLHNFVTRDGTTPDEFRRVGRQQLGTYPNVQARDVFVTSITGTRGAFRVTLQAQAPEARVLEARRILLCTGMIDEMLPIDGFAELWGRSIFQCPYCHGWELRNRRWGYLARPDDTAHLVPFALQARAWTDDFVIFTSGSSVLSAPAREQLLAAGVRIEGTPVVRLLAGAGGLESVELDDGSRVACDVLYAHPPQRQVELIRQLGVGVDDLGYVQTDPLRCETSVAGVYAAGDLTTRKQGAILAAAAGTQAATLLNLDVTTELVSDGTSPLKP